MGSIVKGFWLILSLLTTLIACGPNTFSTRGTVIHPLHDRSGDDPEIGRAPSVLATQRKETRSQRVAHVIVGAQGTPMALRLFGEPCEILLEKTTRNRIIFQCLLFTNYKDELVDMEHGFTLTLSDGRAVPGQIHTKYPVQDHSVTVTGVHAEPYMTVRDRSTGSVRTLYALKEVANEHASFSREFQVIFEGAEIITEATTYVILQIDGYQRRWIYHYDFTNDPAEAMAWWIEHME